MARDSRIFLTFFMKCMLLSLAYGLIGQNVRTAKTYEFPFAVSLSGRPTINATNTKHIANLHFCTGAVVSRRSIVTAAHCLLDKHPDRVEVIAGSTNIKAGQKYYPESWITFDQWNQHQPTRYPLNDIAVITLPGEGIRDSVPISILPVDHNYLNDKNVRIMGWGQMRNGKNMGTLRTAWLKIISNEECSIQGTMVKGQNFSVPPNYFCSKTTPFVLSSLGDGGAPIIDRTYQLVGINIGVCPKVDGYPIDILHELEMNSHLNLYYYQGFLMHAIVKDRRNN